MKNKIVLDYHESFKTLPVYFKKLGINVIFKHKSTVKDKLIKNNQNKGKQCGIYQIPCADCDKVYLGTTGRDLPIRLKEHNRCVRLGDERSAVFLHVSENNNKINFAEGKLLLKTNEYYKRNLIESALIQSNQNKIFNNHPGMFKLNNLILNEINR